VGDDPEHLLHGGDGFFEVVALRLNGGQSLGLAGEDGDVKASLDQMCAQSQRSFGVIVNEEHFGAHNRS